MILVTTAGKVGAHTARLLAARGQVRVLVRDPGAHQDLAAHGVELVAGDLDDRDCVDRATAGADTVVLVSPGAPAQETGVVDSARQAGARHVVKITSDASADSPIARRRDHHQIEVALRSSGLGFTLVRSNAYMQNFLALAPTIAATDAFSSSTGQGRIGMVDTRDVAAVAATLAGAPAAHAGRTYWLSGPERLSYTEAAAQLSSVLGRAITHHAITGVEQVAAMVATGMPPALAQVNAGALELFSRGDSDWNSDDVARLTGRPPGTFARFVTDHAARFTLPTHQEPQTGSATTAISNRPSESMEPQTDPPEPEATPH